MCSANNDKSARLNIHQRCQEQSLKKREREREHICYFVVTEAHT